MKDTLEDFIRKAKAVHEGEDLDYSKVEYRGSKVKVLIVDHGLRPDGTEYGEFWQTPTNHLRGHGHPDRRNGRISSKVKRIDTEEYVRRAMEAHKGENLDYSKTVYRGMHEKVCVICRELRPDGTEYGEFWQDAKAHLNGSTHPDLARDRNSARQRYTTEEFVELAKAAHPDCDYDYGEVDYKGSQEKVKVFCNRKGGNGKPHGMFLATPDNFLVGKGCPKCGNHYSAGEDEICEAIGRRLPEGEKVMMHDRSVLGGLELDIYVPSRKFAVEFDGLAWHGEKRGKDRRYHLSKTERCARNGITLFHVFEDEWKGKKDIVTDKILHSMGLDTGKSKVDARKCTVERMDGRRDETDAFLERNHIQGTCRYTVAYGCFSGDLLIGVCCFTKRLYGYELSRLCTDRDYSCRGCGSRMFKAFVREFSPECVRTFLDRRWSPADGSVMYSAMGFSEECRIAPSYWYTDGFTRRHRFLFRKMKLSKWYGFPMSMTEKEMTERLGLDRVWDCGLIRYVWKASKMA